MGRDIAIRACPNTQRGSRVRLLYVVLSGMVLGRLTLNRKKRWQFRGNRVHLRLPYDERLSSMEIEAICALAHDMYPKGKAI